MVSLRRGQRPRRRHIGVFCQHQAIRWITRNNGFLSADGTRLFLGRGRSLLGHGSSPLSAQSIVSRNSTSGRSFKSFTGSTVCAAANPPPFALSGPYIGLCYAETSASSQGGVGHTNRQRTRFSYTPRPQRPKAKGQEDATSRVARCAGAASAHLSSRLAG